MAKETHVLVKSNPRGNIAYKQPRFCSTPAKGEKKKETMYINKTPIYQAINTKPIHYFQSGCV